MITQAEQTPAADNMIPEYFFCPLTLGVMSDPLVSMHGQNFERNAILQWLYEGNSTCPITRQTLTPSMLIPNAQLRLRIRAWHFANKVEFILCDDETRSLPKLTLSQEDIIQNIRRQADESTASLYIRRRKRS
jgi:hypothetical protein